MYNHSQQYVRKTICIAITNHRLFGHFRFHKNPEISTRVILDLCISKFFSKYHKSLLTYLACNNIHNNMKLWEMSKVPFKINIINIYQQLMNERLLNISIPSSDGFVFFVKTRYKNCIILHVVYLQHEIMSE